MGLTSPVSAPVRCADLLLDRCAPVALYGAPFLDLRDDARAVALRVCDPRAQKTAGEPLGDDVIVVCGGAFAVSGCEELPPSLDALSGACQSEAWRRQQLMKAVSGAMFCWPLAFGGYVPGSLPFFYFWHWGRTKHPSRLT